MLCRLATTILLCLPISALAASDDQICELLINQSIATYPGNCPCPYNLDRGGRRCGARSAYSKQGGYAPLCYPGDVTAGMIAQYRRANAGS
jgi:hypothetical protein